ncbi:trypsin-like serine peptidase [Paracoccus lutimaris]|uniref:Trypsin-like peptidase n=1 Tax=Paracoccus lutimaris TaxID=1490030 RepID=A0A368Z9R5_9RHOB|nr:trypsin-like peptidase domain-containing protein [Paracoccus lutimaris]RCW87204.1 trypsin-like peptidase [Paracoccus lutimaris]
MNVAEDGGSAHALLSEAEARILASHVTGTRPRVAAIFDDLARRSGAVGARDFKTVALGLLGIDAIAAAIMQVDGNGYLDRFLTELSEHGMIDLNAAIRAREAAGGAGAEMALPIERVMPQDASGFRISPQGWTPQMAQWVDMSRLMTGMSQAMRRLCVVRVGENGHDDHTGTGFLIGPQTVLTNWHVVCSLIDPATGHARKGTAANLICEFDHLKRGVGAIHTAVEDWLVDFSPMSLASLGQGKRYPDMTTLRGHALDFCAIRLAGAPGRMRGWFDLSQPGQINEKAELVFVLQHPSGVPQLVAAGMDAKVDPAEADFLRHQARTDDGSSGGLCLDHKQRAIGLHHAEVKAIKDGKLVFAYNRAVLIGAIHRVCPHLGDADPMHDRISILTTGERAVIGRAETQRRIRAMAGKTERPVLYLRGAPRSGKTFSAELLRDCVEAGQHVIVSLSPAALPPSARDLAALILDRAGARPELIAALPQPETPHGTDAAWLTSRLFPDFRRSLYDLLQTDTAPSRLLWLVLDQLGQGDIPQTSARDFLDLLYAEAQRSDRIRVLLIGLSAPLPGLDPLRAATEDIAAPDNIDQQDIETCIAHLLTSHGIAPLPDEIRRHGQLIQAAADLLAETGASRPRLERLSDVLAGIYLKAARNWT